jgi:hypothetical protein
MTVVEEPTRFHAHSPEQDSLAQGFLPLSPTEPYPVTESTVVHIARPIVEYLHENPVDAAIAADRGGRLLALAIHFSWPHRYPGEPFPTVDGSIHFVRNSLSAHRRLDQALDTTLTVALEASKKPTEQQSVLFIDDWVGSGSTFSRFAKSAIGLGLKLDNLHAATLNGANLNMLECDCESCKSNRSNKKYLISRHIVGDVLSLGSNWNDNPEVIGIGYTEGIFPFSRSNQASRARRRDLHLSIADYYKPYLEKLAAAGKSEV